MSKQTDKGDVKRLQRRVEYLEELSRWYAYAVDHVTSMLRLHGAVEAPRDPLGMLHETHDALSRLIGFNMAAYFLVDDTSADFRLRLIHPAHEEEKATALVDQLIEGGEFAWALQQSRAVLLKPKTEEGGETLVLHVIATFSNVRGMFIGTLEGPPQDISSSRLNLLSILLHNCAYAMENAALQHQLRESNRTLEGRIDAALGRITEQNLELTRQVEMLKRTEEALVEAKHAAEAANVAKSRFLATMSHEIRTPMNAIIGMAQMLHESTLSLEQKAYVDIFQKAGENLLMLINDILDLSKIEAGQMHIEPTDFNLEALLEDVLRIFAHHAQASRLEMVHRVAPTLPAWWRGDANRLRQILVNLVGNAVKFTPGGSVNLSVDRDEDGLHGLRFTVADTGIGIPSDKQDAIFAEFTQVDSSTTRRYGGSGLGLSISLRLIQAMHGKIWLESEVGKGSSFHFTLPLHPVRHQTSEVSPAPPQGGEALPTSDRSLAILLVEDSEDNALLVRLFLKGGRYEVKQAENGQVALELFEQNRFDVILMDMQMPVLDGFEATRTIRMLEKDGNLPRTPIIALTAYAFSEDQQRCWESGCDDYLAKPIRKQDLLAAIHKHSGL